MQNFFEVKAKYEKIDQQSGKSKKVTEPYLIDTITFGEAETKAYELLSDQISGEFIVKSIAKSNIAEVLQYPEGEFWFKCKLTFSDIDKESGKQKKTANYILVMADDAKEAYNRVNEAYREMIVPYDIPSVAQSAIVNVFPYVNPDLENETTES